MSTRTYYDAVAHGLPHDPLKAIVAPRPIGWISTYADDGTPNLAPYSFFNLVSDSPKIVMFASVGWKDSATHAVERGAFAVNLATYELRDAVNGSSRPLSRGRSEFEAIGCEPEPCRSVDAPMLAEAAAVLECRTTQSLSPTTLDGTEGEAVIVLGQVVGYHIADRLMSDGVFDSAAARPIARLGHNDYAVVDEVFEMRRPG